MFPEDPESIKNDIRIKTFQENYGRIIKPPPPRPSSARSSQGSHRSGRSRESQDSRHSLRPSEPADTLHPHTRNSEMDTERGETKRDRFRRQGRQNDDSDSDQSMESPPSSRGSSVSRAGSTHNGTAMPYRAHTSNYHPQMHPLSEEAVQISDLQHEINMLRRSLNQIALLQC